MANATPVVTKPRREKRKEREGTFSFLLKLALIFIVLRSFVFSPFTIPSGSMIPKLLIGDYLFITKWNYGYSRYSLPFSVPLIPGRLLGGTPTRGDVVVFKAPPQNDADWIKRVIGLPGDTIQVRDGQVILNGQPIPKQAIADFVEPVSPNSPCNDGFEVPGATPLCHYHQFRETLPGGRSYTVLDRGYIAAADDTDLYTVPAGHVFLMGDNRDDSADSRFSHAAGGIEYVPMENLEGKAVVTFWSTDGSASWLLPWTWFTAARWDRIGKAL